MIYIFFLILILSIIYLAYKYISLYMEIKQVTIQLQDLKNDVTSNQVIRTSTQFNISKNLCNEINSILTIYRKRNVINKKKELMLNQEITNISHDLRTPLTAVKGYTDLLNDPYTTLKEKKRYIGIIEDKTTSLINLVELFHEITKINSLDYKLNFQELSLSDELKNSFLSYYSEFKNQNIDVNFNLSKVSKVVLDQFATNRIFTNLIQNTLRYSKSFVDIDLYEKDNDVIVKLANDTDEQLTQENIKYIFNRSYIADLSRHKQHSGIGLYIVKKLVAKQDGLVYASYKNGIFEIKIHFKKTKNISEDD